MQTAYKSCRDVLIQTEDLAAAERFYSEVMGLECTYKTDTMLGFETGAFALYVEQGPEIGTVFEFFVPNEDEERQELTAAGCTIVKDEPDVPRVYIRDPHGLVFNLAERQE